MEDFRRTWTRGVFSYDVPISHSSSLKSLSSPAGYALSIFRVRSFDDDRSSADQVLATSSSIWPRPPGYLPAADSGRSLLALTLSPTFNLNSDVLSVAERKTPAKVTIFATGAVVKVGPLLPSVNHAVNTNAGSRLAKISINKCHLLSPGRVADEGKWLCSFLFTFQRIRGKSWSSQVISPVLLV